MREIYQKCLSVYDGYRSVVPPYAPAALSFYMLLILIPACSLVAIGTSLLNVDMSFLEEIIQSVVMPEYASMVVDVLESRTINTVALVTIIVSLYTVSRGVGNIYEISKNMYKDAMNESIVSYYIYTIKMTVLFLVMFIGLITVIAIGPLAYFFHFLYSLFGVRHILMYFLLVFSLMGIYALVPRVKVKYSDAFYGALIASALMLILYYGLNIYFRFADFQSVYGPLAFIVVILFVFDWAAEVFYIGMYITNCLHLRRKKDEERKIRN